MNNDNINNEDQNNENKKDDKNKKDVYKNSLEALENIYSGLSAMSLSFSILASLSDVINIENAKEKEQKIVNSEVSKILDRIKNK